jgi:hypothetical protein
MSRDFFRGVGGVAGNRRTSQWFHVLRGINLAIERDTPDSGARNIAL